MKMRREIFVIIVLACCASADNLCPACQSLESAYQALCSPNGTHGLVSSHRGLPGKRGAPGQKGEIGNQGPAGPPAVVDYDKIETEIEEQITLAVDQLNSNDGRLTSLIERLEERITTLERREGTCEIKYNGKCFWVEVRDHFFSGYKESVALCTKRGGSPANIYSEDHFNLIMPYLRTKILTGREYIHLWLGMRYNPATRQLTLSNGNPAPFTRMYPGYPSANPTYTHVTVVQRIPASRSIDVGFHNFPLSAEREGALCEI